MMLLDRWLVGGVVGAGLLTACLLAPGQAPPAKGKHPAKAKVVLPANGAPPEQAVQPDGTAPLEQTTPTGPTLPADEMPPPLPAPPVPVPEAAAPPDAPAETHPASAAAAPEPPAAPRVAPPGVALTGEQQQLDKDAAALLLLTEQLKAELDKAGNDTLSIAAVRKADEVQRLSRALKEKIRERGLVSGKP